MQSLAARVSKVRRLLLAFVLFPIPLLSVARLNEINLAVSTEITLQTNLVKVLPRQWVWRYGFQSPCSISHKRGLHSF
jgi:hypothetical protein